MKKTDLKSGMVCEHRNGKMSIVMVDTFEKDYKAGCFVFAHNDRSSFSSFNENFQWIFLIEKEDIGKDPCDIVKIYQPKKTYVMDLKYL